MVKRCTNPNDKNWAHYGGRGIRVCERWMDATNFIADMGEVPPGMTIELKEVNGNYEPGNCVWATQREQTRNTRRTHWLEIDGTRKPMSVVAEEAGMSYSTLRARIYRGVPPAEAIKKGGM